MSTITTVIDPKGYHLTEIACRERGDQPLYVGDFWLFRFQVLDADGEAVDLTLAELTAEFTGSDGTTVVGRSSEDALDFSGDTLQQINIDAGQDTGDNTEPIGKGWAALYFAPNDAEALATILGLGTYWIRVDQVGDDRPSLLLRGDSEVVDP